MILVLGATGNVGRVVVELLCDAGEPVRVLTRNPHRVGWSGSVKVIHGDLHDEATVRGAMAGADRLFSLSFIESPHDLDRRITEAARAAGIRHVTKLSTIGATSPIPIGQRHRTCEESVMASGMSWTVLRPGYFMANTLRWAAEIRSGGRVRVPVPDASIAPISEIDVAAVAARSLLEAGHSGHIYELTGETLITAREQVATLARVLDRQIECDEVDIGSAIRPMGERGLPGWLIESRRLMLASMSEGQVDRVTPTFRDLMRRPPMRYEEWCQVHRGDFS